MFDISKIDEKIITVFAIVSLLVIFISRGKLFSQVKEATNGLQSFQVIATKIIEAIFLFLTGQEGRELIQAQLKENNPENGNLKISAILPSDNLASRIESSGTAVGSKLTN